MNHESKTSILFSLQRISRYGIKQERRVISVGMGIALRSTMADKPHQTVFPNWRVTEGKSTVSFRIAMKFCVLSISSAETINGTERRGAGVIKYV